MNARFGCWVVALSVFMAVGCGREGPTVDVGARKDEAPSAAKGPQERPEHGAGPIVPEGTPDIAARIGDEVITAAEFERAVAGQVRLMQVRAMAGSGLPFSDAPQITLTSAQRAQILESMIDARVLALLARDAGIEIPDEAVDRAIEEGKRNLAPGMTFEEYLRENEMTVDQLAEHVRERLMKERFVEEQTKDITVTEAEVASEYEVLRRQGQMARPETVDVSRIVIAAQGADEAAWAAAREKIESARERILAGEPFAEIAKEVSEDKASAWCGGALPPIERGGTDPEFERRAFELPIGEVSEPFRTRYGWQILTVTGRRKAGTMSLEEATADLRKTILGIKRREVMEKVIAGAKATIDVEIVPSPETMEQGPAEAASV